MPCSPERGHKPPEFIVRLRLPQPARLEKNRLRCGCGGDTMGWHSRTCRQKCLHHPDVRDVTFEDGDGPFLSHERFFHVHASADPCVEGMSDLEKRTFEGFRW